MKYKTLALTLVSTCALIFSSCNKQPEKRYNIQFVDDDEVTILYETTVKKGQVPVYEGAEPTKESTAQYSYSWTGWNPAIEAATQDQIYVATYQSTLREYQITFLNGDGSVLQSSNVAYGETPVCAETPTKESSASTVYTFDHWEPAVAPVTGPQTYEPRFSETTRQYQITFKNGDGTTLQQSNVDYGALPICSETPTKAQDDVYTYTFNHWDPAITEVSQDQTYTPVFDAHVRALDVDEAYDFTQFKYGAGEMRNFDDDVSWAMPAAEAHTLKYKVYSTDIFELKLPRIVYAEHSDVSMKFEGTNYHGRVLLGLDEDDITHGDGVESDRDIVGTLMLSYMDGKLYQSLAFGTMTINNVIEDEDVINGIKPVSIFVKALYDRFFNVFDITFGTEGFVAPTFDLTNNLAGATETKLTDGGDVTWVMRQTRTVSDVPYTSDADHLMFATYNDSTTNDFRLNLPKVNFALFKAVEMDLFAPGWNSNAKVGLKVDDISYSSGNGDSDVNGHLSFVLTEGKLLAILDFGTTHIEQDVTNEDVIIGKEGPKFFSTSYYNRQILISNITVRPNAEVELKHDWSVDKMGAQMFKDGADVTWAFGTYTTSSVLGYKVYETSLFKLVMPKINYSLTKQVRMVFHSTVWQSGVKFGLLENDVNYTTNKGADAGGNISSLDGELAVVNNGESLAVTFTLGDTVVTNTVTDSNIINGTASIDLFVKALYDRNLPLTNIYLQF